MEHAGVSVEAGPLDQLDQGYQLDLDPNTELEVEGLDFGLDGSYDEHTEEVSDDAVALNFDPQLSYGDQEPHAAAAGDEQAQTTEVAEDAGNDAEAEVEYHDEIGYEDDDLVTTDINANLSTTEVGAVEAGLPNALPENHLEFAQPADNSHAEPLSHEKEASWDQDINFDEHDESTNPQDELGGADENTHPQDELGGAGKEETVGHLEGNELAVDDFDDESAHEQFPTDHHDDDLEKALEDFSQSLADMPDVEVLYNEEVYSLFGTSDDNPLSYFLSDVKELDRPLSQFFSALRAVVSDELTPTDELVIRFDPLDLEFGERSNESFLTRSFREVLDCHATLGRVPGISADPVIHLTVRRDSEDHFLELLAEAQLVKGSPKSAEDSEMSENQDEESRASGLDGGQIQDELYEDENFGEDYDEGEDTVTDHVEDKAEPELEIPPSQDDVAGELDNGVQVGESAPQSPSVSAEAFDGEEHSGDIHAEAHSDDLPEDGAGEEQAWDEPAADDDATASPHAEISLDMSDERIPEPTEQQEGNESLGTTVDEVSGLEDGGREQEAGSNGKYSSFLSPEPRVSLYRNLPAAISPLLDDDRPGPAAQASPSSSAANGQEEFWEIDYSDDEFEPTPSRNLEDGALSISESQAQGPSSLGSGTNSKWARASSANSFCTSKTSESSDVSMAFSFNTDANKDAYQDDDLILAFDEDPGLSTIHEEIDEYEEYTITYDAPDNLADDAEGTQAPDAAETTEGSAGKDSETGAYVATVAETASVHTSTTINGDEIDYDEEDAADDTFTPADDGTRESVATSGINNDEIDWENDEDEYEQPAADEENDVEHEEPKEVALSPPSVAGKRSRTNEAESLADETGMPTCPPPKRIRMC
ncbi:hypothetical protein C8A00DRAFT_12382 [Chaetomidium leptoderma]|uniref:Uncharacterized protein n=1 Tax=Chaetomidium leptoderma TaxID=669021 RepID=A0AAN6ZYH1_9PEZI|nr:hypothetical protein C8A00DRAFT_12382 [Chaetomidium leptoderma]